MFSAASVSLSVCLFVNRITYERLNVGWWWWWRLGALYKNLARGLLSRSEVKRKGHHGPKTRIALPPPLGAYEWYALAADSVQQQRTGPFRGCRGVLWSCVVRQFYAGGTVSECCHCCLKSYQFCCSLIVALWHVFVSIISTTCYESIKPLPRSTFGYLLFSVNYMYTDFPNSTQQHTLPQLMWELHPQAQPEKTLIFFFNLNNQNVDYDKWSLSWFFLFFFWLLWP